jgi:hypothetical protein
MATKRIEEIKAHSLFEGLFTINDKLLSKIEQNMRDENYDDSQPIILATWEGQDDPVCIDGHTRLKAATKAGIEEVPFYSYEFETEEDAFEYAIRLQSNRRNLTDGDLIHCIERLHREMPRGGDRRSEQAKESTPQGCGTENGRSAGAKRTADLLNISARKVEQALTVIAHGSTETKQAVVENEMSINRAYGKTQKERQQAESESSAGFSEEQATDDGKEEEGQDSQVSKFEAPVFISMEHFGALHELGGSVEDHLATAVEHYLDSLKVPTQEDRGEKDREDGQGQNHREECDTEDTDAEEEDQEESDDDDYLDPGVCDNEAGDADERQQNEEEHEEPEDDDEECLFIDEAGHVVVDDEEDN